jgi:hypothetical protein
MLDYQVISKKPVVTIVNGDEENTMYDLLVPTFNGHMEKRGFPILVTPPYVARPDLVSLAVYGSDRYADILCKTNGVSNPFELNAGMILWCPQPDELVNYVTGVQKISSSLVAPKASKSTRYNSNGTPKTPVVGVGTNIGKAIGEIGESLNNKKKAKNERRSSSEQTITDENYIIDKSLGIIIY